MDAPNSSAAYGKPYFPNASKKQSAMSRRPPAGIYVPKPRSRSPENLAQDVRGIPPREWAEEKRDPRDAAMALEQRREQEAKNRRLLRFSLPPAVPSEAPPVSAAGIQKSKGKQKSPEKAVGKEFVFGDDPGLREIADGTMADERDWRTAEPVLGSCPDMCPETERLERERKGDLDWFERLDGERNQTSRGIAVKKYARMADREPSLIRPLAVLKSTMEYLTALLGRGYGKDLLPLYNFLWDRMRAIRTDLRMQHIFDLDAVKMHEKMIRFHIMAMHELCEYKKGEGFNEGFDAHLNIEQMNKASVDLFQMYDDHRRQGHPLATEAEFRGYYALLKLDKHPGYLVEPVELSLDLAQMTPEIRKSPEIYFAREVARACRLSNFIAFFRLARKASYLQACLMHAHFSKLRSQALASLYSALQKSQGIPLSQISMWLGMENEDMEMEGLLNFHGYSIKQYEELYMVKDGPFLNKDITYPTHKSTLVESKHSLRISDDMQFQSTRDLRTAGVTGQNGKIKFEKKMAPLPSQPPISDEEMPDYEEEELQRYSPISWNMARQESPYSLDLVHEPVTVDSSVIITKGGETKELEQWQMDTQLAKPNRKRERQPQMEEEIYLQESSKRHEKSRNDVIDKASPVNVEKPGHTFYLSLPNLNAAKCFRKWRTRTLEQLALLEKNRAEEQAALEQRRKRAEEALLSLCFGPPIRWKDKVETAEFHEHLQDGVMLDPGGIRKLWSSKMECMWTPLDVPSLIISTLKEITPSANCLCWKLVFCCNAYDAGIGTLAGQWLRAKLLHADQTNDKKDNASMQLQEAFIKQVQLQVGDADVCLCYVVKEAKFLNGMLRSKVTFLGASAILFLLGEEVSMREECMKLRALVDAIPNGTRASLVILSLLSFPDKQAISNVLDMSNQGSLKISGWSFFSILDSLENEGTVEAQKAGSIKTFFSDSSLIDAIKWLASMAQSQPDVHACHLQGLVSEYLQSSLKLLLAKRSLATPQMCIDLFNHAILNIVDEIKMTARSAPPNWPPPEFGFALDMPREPIYGLSQAGLPYCGWNEVELLQPIFDVLHGCLLPPFPCHTNEAGAISHLSVTQCIESQNLLILRNLELYLIEIGGYSCAAKEAEFMFYSANSLHWTERQWIVVPDWLHIFQRIFYDRLLLLNSEPPPLVYILGKARRHVEIDNYENSICVAQQLRGGLNHTLLSYAQDEPQPQNPVNIETGVTSKVSPRSMVDANHHRRSMMQRKTRKFAMPSITSAPLNISRCNDSLQEKYLAARPEEIINEAEVSEKLIILSKTDAETHLDSLLSTLHQKLDKQIHIIGIDIKEFVYPQAKDLERIDEYILSSANSFVEKSHKEPDKKHDLVTNNLSWAQSDAFKELSERVEQCERQQLLIDGKLEAFFGI